MRDRLERSLQTITILSYRIMDDRRRRARFPAAVHALAVMLQLANLVTAATCAADGAGAGSVSSEMSHNMIEGLKLNRLPDMTKVRNIYILII